MGSSVIMTLHFRWHYFSCVPIACTTVVLLHAIQWEHHAHALPSQHYQVQLVVTVRLPSECKVQRFTLISLVVGPWGLDKDLVHWALINPLYLLFMSTAPPSVPRGVHYSPTTDSCYVHWLQPEEVNDGRINFYVLTLNGELRYNDSALGASIPQLYPYRVYNCCVNAHNTAGASRTCSTFQTLPGTTPSDSMTSKMCDIQKPAQT